MNCKKCGNPLPDHENFCKICDTVQDEQNVSARPQPSKLLNALTHFFLPLTVAVLLIYTVLYITGLIRTFDFTAEAYADWSSTYAVAPILKVFDISFALCFLGLAAFTIVTMVQLLKRKAGAPNCYIALHLTFLIASIALGFIDYTLRLSIGEQTVYDAPSPFLFFPPLLIWIAANAIAIHAIDCNFRKHTDLFTAK